MKKIYDKPELVIQKIDNTDIVAASTGLVTKKFTPNQENSIDF